MIIKKDAIVFTGGCGDILKILDFTTPQERARVKTIYWAAKTRKVTQHLLKAAHAFPSLKKEVVAWDNFELFHAIYAAENLFKITQNVPPGYKTAQDLSISKIFRQIIDEKIPFQGSCLLKKIAEIEKFNLPKSFICISPGTTNSDGSRDFSLEEWMHLIKWLDHTDQVGVVIGSGIQVPYEADCLVNLVDKTTPSETVEVIKAAKSAIMIDSWPGLIAAQTFSSDRLIIKSKNIHFYSWKSIYLAPHKSFEFVTKDIKPMSHDPAIASYPYINLSNKIRWCYLHDICYQTETLSLELPKSSYNPDFSKIVGKYCGDKPIMNINSDQSFDYAYRGKVYNFGLRFRKDRKNWRNPWTSGLKDIEGYCFWNTFGSVIHPSLLLSRIPSKKYIFISIDPLEQILLCGGIEGMAEKMHGWNCLRLNEIIYYWTKDSLIKYMKDNKCDLIEECKEEKLLLIFKKC